MTITLQTRYELAEERGNYCEFCKLVSWTDLHHAILRRDKRYHQFVDMKVNLMCICRTCHMSGLADTYQVKQLYFWVQHVRGYDPITWFQQSPLKVLPKFPEQSCDLGILANSLELSVAELLELKLFS